MPGKGRGRTLGPVWTVAVVPAGTTAEAGAAARRAQQLVAEWIRAGIGAVATTDRAGAAATHQVAATHQAGAGG